MREERGDKKSPDLALARWDSAILCPECAQGEKGGVSAEKNRKGRVGFDKVYVQF